MTKIENLPFDIFAEKKIVSKWLIMNFETVYTIYKVVSNTAMSRI